MLRRTIHSSHFQFALLCWFCLALTGTALAGEIKTTNTGTGSGGSPLTEADIKTMLRDYIDNDNLGDALVVGIVDEHGTHVISYRKLDNGTDAEANGDTEFDIGSATKVFTALLLQDMVDRGEMNLNDPLQKYLPAPVKVPTYHGRQITLLDLATHTSGLPRDDDGNFYGSLTHCVLKWPPGTHWEYSNFGMALLGQAIVLKAGKDYDTLLTERICRPLGMASTGVALTPEERARLAIGHAVPGHRVHGIGLTLYPGAGAIHSTANDLLKFISAYCGLSPSPLTGLMQRAEQLHALQSGQKSRLVWPGTGTVFEHGGLLEGYQAELAFDVKKRRGIVELSNCSSFGTFVSGSWQPLLMNGRSPRPAKTVLVDPTLYDRYTGLYQFERKDYCTVRCVAQRLLIQWLGERGTRDHLPSFEVFPVSERVFQNELADVQAAFSQTTNRLILTGQGQAGFKDPIPLVKISTKLILTSLGPMSGFDGFLGLSRISMDVPAPPACVLMDSSIYKNCVGQYRKTLLFGLIRLGPTLHIFYKRDELGDHLFSSVSGISSMQGSTEIFPTSEYSFIPGPTVGDEFRLTFVRSRKGVVTGGIAYWNGMAYRGTRIPNKPAN